MLGKWLHLKTDNVYEVYNVTKDCNNNSKDDSPTISYRREGMGFSRKLSEFENKFIRLENEPPPKTVIFLGGRYRMPEGGTDAIYENLHSLRQKYKELVKMGFTVVCPNLSSAFMDGFITDYDDFVEGTKEQLSRCDIAVFVEGWEYSSGCKKEIEHAKAVGVPTILSISYESDKNYKYCIHKGFDGVKEMLGIYKKLVDTGSKFDALLSLKAMVTDMEIDTF
jgi:hypothetical protein